MQHRPLALCLALLPVLAACSTTAGRSTTSPQEPAAHAAAHPPRVLVGAEVQAYPAGVISGVHFEHFLAERHYLTLRVAYNDTDRSDYGEHDDEEGGGAGGGVGYRYFFDASRTGWMIGGRVDLWDLEIDWEDDPNLSGSTDVLVLQPTVEGGYSWHLGGGWFLDATLSLGAEINIDEDGEDVGEGAILLGGLTFTYSF